MHHLLVADIGGTRARFAHFSLQHGTLHKHGTYEQSTPCLKCTEDALKAASYTGLHPYKADALLWGLAGLIEEGGLFGTLTNGALELDFRTWGSKHPILVNDFTLQAWATLALPSEYIYELSTRPSTVSAGTKCVVGAGTGLGVGTLVYIGKKKSRKQNSKKSADAEWSVLASEGGHVDFSFTLQEKAFVDFAQYTLQQERISAEDVLSGRGLSLIYEYVHGKKVSPKYAAQSFHDKQENNAVLSMYARFLGRFCRHVALQSMCTGGLYLSGSVLTCNPAIVAARDFHEEFLCVPPNMLPLIQNIPLALITHAQPGLWGAAFAAQRMLVRCLF